MSEELCPGGAIHEGAVDAARQAGNLLRESGASGLRHVDFQDATDVKLRADKESERLVRGILEASGLPVVGEEFGGEESLPSRAELYWVVDPLDGTYNYLRGQPLTCVSIGLMRGAEPVFGVIYDFNADMMWTGGPGLGLSCNGQAWVSSWAESLEGACLLTGFPAGRDFGEDALLGFVREVRRFKKVRMIGSAALACVYVASGLGDVYVEESVRLWDVAAGLALVRGAGGVCRMEPVTGKPFAWNVWAAGRRAYLSSWGT